MTSMLNIQRNIEYLNKKKQEKKEELIKFLNLQKKKEEWNSKASKVVTLANENSTRLKQKTNRHEDLRVSLDFLESQIKVLESHMKALRLRANLNNENAEELLRQQQNNEYNRLLEKDRERTGHTMKQLLIDLEEQNKRLTSRTMNRNAENVVLQQNAVTGRGSPTCRSQKFVVTQNSQAMGGKKTKSKKKSKAKPKKKSMKKSKKKSKKSKAKPKRKSKAKK
jgi:hypothetical protein